MKVYLVCAAIVALSASCANAASVSCGIGKFFDNPTVNFGEISDGLRIEDFSDTGTFGLTAVVTGNGNTAIFAETLYYKKVGGRIEFDGDAEIWIRQVTMDQFQSEFGLFPEVTCSTP